MSEEWKVDIDVAGVRDAIIAGARDGLSEALDHILDVSNKRVPRESGELEKSGRAGLVGTLKGGVGYDSERGGVIAITQHENMRLQHDGGRSAKFLENALNSERNQAAEIIAAAIRRKIGGQ